MARFAIAVALTLSASAQTCDINAAQPWIQHWLGAWNFTSRQILHLPDAPLPNIIFFDNTCVYTNVGGKWHATPHGGTITLPNKKTVPVQLMSFADADEKSGPFFVMAAPEFWKQAVHAQEPGLTAVFLHEFSHTRQFAGMAAVIGPIDKAWKGPEELDDDIVQTRFGSNPDYVADYKAEYDLLLRAANAASIDETRALAAQALDVMKKRRARWFTGDNAVFVPLDSTWLSMEGAGQWTGYAWLSDPHGGGMTRADARKKMIGSGKHWTQDEGLVLFLVVDRLLPEWPTLVFHTPSMGALELLERAVKP